jgi:hypothetical protein
MAWDNIVTFPSSSERERVKRAAPKPNYTERRKNRKSMRSYNLIAESDDADLISDVCLDMHKAEVKLRQLREALQATRENSAARIEMLTEAEIKLSAALVAALLSARSNP